MNDTLIVIVALLVLTWSLVSGALARVNLTGPLLFTLAGYVIGNPDWGPVPVSLDSASVHFVAEITLALVLFSDACRVNLGELRRDLGPPVRLLAIGLPITVLVGGIIAALLFEDLPWALAGFIGAALAPTDAALSSQVINDKTIPLRLRRVLNVESGLNDGIATPIVTSLLLIAASQLGLESEGEGAQLSAALQELGGGIVVGLVLGLAGARSIRFASARAWMAPGTRRLAVLAVAVATFMLAVDLGFNGFIAAFVAGMAFGAEFVRGAGEADQDLEEVDELPELGGQLLALVVWFLFGATLLPVAFDELDAVVVLYALLSLTVIRMGPVALATLRSDFDRPTVAFLGWFGPRGLASVVFALLAMEELGENSVAVDHAVATVTITVLCSVVLHGISAGPGGRRYVKLEAKMADSDADPSPRTAGWRLPGGTDRTRS